MADEALYSDIEISGDDLALDGVQARMLTDRDVIVQDLIHAIRESGYLVRMTAERTPSVRQLLRNKIILLAEDDTRIVPGTVRLTGPADRMRLTARTADFGVVGFYVNWSE